MKPRLLSIVAVIALIGVGFLVAWGIYRPRPAKPEPPAPAVRQADGSLELERAPSGLKAGAPGGSSPIKPAQIIPKGAKVERIVQITVDPSVKPSSGRNAEGFPGGLSTPHGSLALSLGPSSVAACPPVTVDLTLVRMPDKTQRVLASSPNGEVVGGIDVPVQAPAVPRIQRWTAAGLAGYDSHAGRNVFGGQVSYARGPFVLSGGVIGGTAFVGAGVRF
jgi:hypothetical protein